MTSDQRVDAYLVKALAMIDEHGWMLQGVFSTEQDPGPPFVYTVGMSLFGHQEFILIGLPPELAGTLLNDLGARVRDGQRFAAGQVIGDLISGYDVRLVAVTDSTEHLTMANRLFEHINGNPVAALQVVWPDKAGRFPWDAGFAHTAAQPLLGKTSL